MINLKPIITASAVLLLLNACSSSDSTTATDGTEISALAVSGVTVGLNGTYKTDCYDNSAGTGTSFAQEELVISGNTWNYTQNSYTDDVCTTGASIDGSAAATIAAGADSAITGWVDGMDLPTAAPLAADGSGLLGDTESYTLLTITFTATAGSLSAFISAGDTGSLFYIIDNTGTNNVMYRDDDAETNSFAGTADPYIKQ